MTRVLKIFLIWLLACALPMQGYAAATMFSCHTAPEHLPSQHVSKMAHIDHASMHAAMHATTSGDTLHHQHHRNAMQPGSGHTSHDASGKHLHSSCSTCSVCCVGVAVLPAAPKLHKPFGGMELRLATPAISFSGHVPSGLERPPRVILV